MSRTAFKVLDIFSGIGGFSLGLESTGGFDTVAFCEIESYCRAVLAKHWPKVPCYNDVRELTASKLAADGISVDVICGGFPCQDISDAGKRAGLSGTRSGLWSEFRRLIDEIRPQWAIIENVAALRARGLEAVLQGLDEIGYDTEWHCIPASHVGAPHQRDRIWIIAHPNSSELRDESGRRSGQMRAYPPQSAEHGQTQSLANAIGIGREISATWPQQQGRSQASTGCEISYVGNSDRLRQLQPQGIFSDERRWSGNSGWWNSEPDVGRVANGVSKRVDRVRCLGNAVVPQIPALIGEAILRACA